MVVVSVLIAMRDRREGGQCRSSLRGSLPGTPGLPAPSFHPCPVSLLRPRCLSLKFITLTPSAPRGFPHRPTNLSPHGGPLLASSRPTSAFFTTARTSSSPHRFFSPPAHVPRSRTFQQYRTPQLPSQLSNYGPASPAQPLSFPCSLSLSIYQPHLGGASPCFPHSALPSLFSYHSSPHHPGPTWSPSRHQSRSGWRKSIAFPPRHWVS